jgi:hypothetical protein
MKNVKIKDVLAIVFCIFFLTNDAFSQQKEPRTAEALPGPSQANIAERTELFDSIEVDILEKLQKLGVAVFLAEPEMSTSTADYKVALNLGVSVADAISSAVNKDQTKLLKFAKIIHDYGERLDVKSAILDKYNDLTKAVSNNQWDKVITLTNALKDDITTELKSSEMEKNDEAVLAMVSGWIEGLYIVAKSLDKNFSEEAKTLLSERDFVRYLNQNLQSLTEDNKNTKEVKAILEALPKIDGILNKPLDYSYTIEDVRRILQISESLRIIIMMS